MKELKIYFTSDSHGWLYPQGEGSFLQCIEKFEIDGNTLVLDGGDTIQGSPLVKYLHTCKMAGEILGYGFRCGGYQYYTLGNHDFNYGYEGIASFVEHMAATCLCANVRDTSGRLDIRPYAIHTMENGLRVGIIGAVTDFVNFWESQERISPLEVTDTFTAIEEAVQALKGSCDMTICLYHGGFEEDLNTGLRLFQSRENIAGELCRKLDLDILLTGHQHKTISGRYYHGTYVIQPPEHGKGYAELAVSYVEPILPHAAPTLGIESSFHEPSDTVSEKVLKFFLPPFQKAKEWLQLQIATLPTEMRTGDKVQMAMLGSDFANLQNYVQLEATDSEISCAALPNPDLVLGERVTVGSVLKAFPYANKLVVIEITGEILLEMLQHTASYLRWTPEKIQVDSRYLSPKTLHYHYEYFAHVHYTVKLSPFGENTIEEVEVMGEPLQPQRVYRLALSEFRASGVGGYEFLRDCPVVEVIEEDIQDLVLNFFHSGGDIKNVPNYHFIDVKIP